MRRFALALCLLLCAIPSAGQGVLDCQGLKGAMLSGTPVVSASCDRTIEFVGLGAPVLLSGGSVRYTGTGPLIRIIGAHDISLSRVVLTRATPGPLVTIEGGAYDAAFIALDRVTFDGGWLQLSRALAVRITDGVFRNAPNGIVTGSGVNGLLVSNATFFALTDVAILSTGSSQRWTIADSIFEPSQDGRASGFRQDNGGYVWALSWLRNWHGDVSAGGRAWLTDVHGLGVTIAGNYFGTAGPATALIQLSGSQGVAMSGNRFEGASALDFGPGYSWGISLEGNDLMTATPFLRSFVLGLRAVGNNNLADR